MRCVFHNFPLSENLIFFDSLRINIYSWYGYYSYLIRKKKSCQFFAYEIPGNNMPDASEKIRERANY